MQRFPRSKSVLTKLSAINQKEATQTFLYNRNPKNLEKLKIAYNHNGYHLEKPGKTFYNKYENIIFFKTNNYILLLSHRLIIEPTGNYVTAKVVHLHDGTIIEASTKEWAIKKYLCKTSNTSAYENLARVY